MSPFMLILRQTLYLSLRKGGGIAGCAAFYLMLLGAFVFSFGMIGAVMNMAAIACLCLLYALIALLPLYFQQDDEDGTLEQIILSPMQLEWLILAKICGLWLASLVPLLLVMPLIYMIASMPLGALSGALLPVIFASIILFCAGAIAAALSIGVSRGGFLQSVLVLPLYLPAVMLAADYPAHQAGLWLFIYAVIAVPLSCVVSAMLIRKKMA